MIIERVAETKRWKPGIFIGYYIHKETNWKWQVYKAVILGDLAIGFRKVEEFRSLKDAMAGLELIQGMWLEAVYHADTD